MSKWCTVTVIDASGRRHSLDLLAESSFDAAHLFVVEAKPERSAELPKPSLGTVFEVVTGGRIYRSVRMAGRLGLSVGTAIGTSPAQPGDCRASHPRTN